MSFLEPVEEKTFRKLRIYNLFMGVFHLSQGLLMLYLSKPYTLPITESFIRYDESMNFDVVQTATKIVDVSMGPLVASFLLLSAIAHFITISPGVFGWYKEKIQNRINPIRWYEYALSSSLMIVIIAMFCGLYEWAALLAIFGVNAMMNLFGYMMEADNQNTKKTRWVAYYFGVVAGIIPWIVVFGYFFGAVNANGAWDVMPKFVYGIIGSIFIFFNIFAINMVLQYKKVGPWRNYVFGEVVYIALSLVAKSALAWQIFTGTLR